MNEIIKITVLAIFAALGVGVSDSELVTGVIAAFTQADIKIQGAILAVILIATVVPLIAPYTPWTWDDRAIDWAPTSKKIIGSVWRALASNHGKAKNNENS